MNCIFCKHDTSDSTTSHILPASLGGEEWACLPDGIVCSGCNQYFGEKVENPALGSFPFLPFRVLLGIPTRKGKAPKLSTCLGTLKGSPLPGCIGIDPTSEDIERGINSGRLNQVRILAEPTEPLVVCRMLVKMGLEVVANDCPDDAQSPKFDSARMFARMPAKGTRWWFMINTDHGLLFKVSAKRTTSSMPQ
ncbi:HNH endonuclease [Desulfolithobacter dissulfuricans]|uniref:HNH endonuclease n=1 Tax=Desulfolithobacter dissulfuricans TaxID=2795293 RepID=UPI00338E2F3B